MGTNTPESSLIFPIKKLWHLRLARIVIGMFRIGEIEFDGNGLNYGDDYRSGFWIKHNEHEEGERECSESIVLSKYAWKGARLRLAFH